MNINIKVFVVFVLAICLMTGQNIFAQEEETGNVFAISTWKVGFNKVSEVLDNWEKEFTPIAAENEFILSQKTFTHLWGPDWNLVVITEYQDLASIEKAQQKFNELFEKKYPEKSKQDEVMKKMRSYFRGHDDAIVREVPKLRK
jgi:hypothetical protein